MAKRPDRNYEAYFNWASSILVLWNRIEKLNDNMATDILIHQ